MISVMNDQRRTFRKTGGQFGFEPFPGHGRLHQPGVVLLVMSIGKACGSEGTLAVKAPGRGQLAVVRAVIEVGQRIQEARRGIAFDALHVGAERRFQEHRIGIGRLKSIDIERRLEIIDENAFADTDRTVERIVVEKAAAAARSQHGFVPKPGQRFWKTIVESANAPLEKKIGVRTETRARKARQQAEFGLPRSAAENIDVEASVATLFRRQECLDNRLHRKSEDARIEHRLMLDDDNVGKIEAARRHRRHQRQRIFCYVAEREAAELPPGKRVEKRGREGRIETPRLRHDALKRNGTAAGLVGCAQSQYPQCRTREPGTPGKPAARPRKAEPRLRPA